MIPMVEMAGKVTRSRYDELVADSLDLVEEQSAVNLRSATRRWSWSRFEGTAVTCCSMKVIRVCGSPCGCPPRSSGYPSIRSALTGGWPRSGRRSAGRQGPLRGPPEPGFHAGPVQADPETAAERADRAGPVECGGGEEGEEFHDPARVVHSWKKSMKFTALIAICQRFIAGAARLVPKLRMHELTDAQTKVLENSVGVSLPPAPAGTLILSVP